MTEAISLYISRASGAHRLHPFTKLTIAIFLLVGGMVLPGPWAVLSLLLPIVLLLAIWGRVFKELIGATWQVAFPFALSVFLIQGFLWPGGTPVFAIGPVSMKIEGVTFAVESSARILIIVSSFLWFTYTTRPDVLMTALAQHGLPAGLSYVVITALQIIPRFQARAAAILDAQRSRGMETGGNLIQRARALPPLVTPLILSSLIDVEERALALEARGFNYPGLKTSLIEIQDILWERIVRWLIIITTVLMLGLGFWLRLTN